MTDPYLDPRTGILRNRLGIGDADELARLTDLVGNLNALHPFRDGNGRTLRAFVAQLAREAGYELRWRAMDPAENVAASRASLAGDDARSGGCSTGSCTRSEDRSGRTRSLRGRARHRRHRGPIGRVGRRAPCCGRGGSGGGPRRGRGRSVRGRAACPTTSRPRRLGW
ncbi:Fic family protein [Actinomycetospora atypica]|uniref:Fic family protein n=1 Tax=Actinomycetospora atypica TaxID=1290095 RepID=A0ABV9YU40_9PSEU